MAPRLGGPLALPGDDVPTIACSAQRHTSATATESSSSPPIRRYVPSRPHEQWTAGDADDDGSPATFPHDSGTTPPPAPAATGAGQRRRRHAGRSRHGNLGPPVDLWDADWPDERLLLDRHPGRCRRPRPGRQRSSPRPARSKGADVDPGRDDRQLPGRRHRSRSAPQPASDTATITAIGQARSRWAPASTQGHSAGERGRRDRLERLIVSGHRAPAGRLRGGPLRRFGISSEPSLTTRPGTIRHGPRADRPPDLAAANVPRSTAARSSPGRPRSAADIYEIQYSKTSVPVQAGGRPAVAGKPAYLTFCDVRHPAVRPLDARARGTTAFAASTTTCRPACSRWAGPDPEQLVVTKPTLSSSRPSRRGSSRSSATVEAR